MWRACPTRRLERLWKEYCADKNSIAQSKEKAAEEKEGKWMTQREKEFLDAMWKKAEEKEQNMRLAEELTKTPLNKGVNSFLWDLF